MESSWGVLSAEISHHKDSITAAKTLMLIGVINAHKHAHARAQTRGNDDTNDASVRSVLFIKPV